MKITINNPDPTSTQTSSWMDDYTASLAKSYARYLDSLIYKHMTPFERFLFNHKIYWPLKVFSKYSIVFNIETRTQTLMKGSKKLEEIKSIY